MPPPYMAGQSPFVPMQPGMEGGPIYMYHQPPPHLMMRAPPPPPGSAPPPPPPAKPEALAPDEKVQPVKEAIA